MFGSKPKSAKDTAPLSKASPTGAKPKAKVSDPYKMTCDDVCNFLDSIEMGVYKKSFRAQEINGEAMLELNEADMLALKLTSPSERAKLMMAISQLKAKFARTKNDAEDDSESNSNSASGSRGSSTAMSADPKRVEDLSGQIEAIRRSQCVATFSMDGTILDANDVFLNAMGYSLAEVKGKHHSMFVTPDYASSREYAQFWERLRNNEFHAAEFKRIGKGGKEVWLQATYSPILDANNKPFKVVKYATDITASKKRAEVQFKCVYGSETRVLKTAGDISFDKFCRKVRSSFGHRMNIRYTDKSGDVISVKSDEEFLSMLVEFRNESVIRLQLSRRRDEAHSDNGDTAILETMINPVIIINGNGIMQFVNSATTRLVGYSRTELTGQNVKMLMPASTADRHDNYLDTYLRTGVAHIIGKGRVIEVRRKDGSLVHMDLAVSHTRQRKSDVFTGTFSEVKSAGPSSPTSSGGNLADSGLASGFAMLENLLFSAIVADSKGQILFANAHAGRLFGYEKAQLIGKNVRLLMPNPDSDKHDSYLAAYLETRQAKVIGRGRDVVGMMKDGSLVPLNLTISEQVIGNQSMFTAILRPLSEDAPRTDTKSVMQAERDMLATLPVPAVMIDERGSIQGFNEAASQMWGWKLTEVVGRNVKMLMPNPERDRHDGYLKRYLETGKQRVFGLGRDVSAVHKDGSVLPVRLSVSEKKDDNKRIFTAIIQKLN